MMSLSRTMLLATLVCLMPGIAGAQSVAQMLQDMNSAYTNHSYDGVFSYYTGGELASLRVVHKQVDGVQRERLVHLNGAPREIIRRGEVVSCIVMPGDDLIALEKSIPAGPFARAFVRQFDQIPDIYTVGTFGEGRAAGRTAVRVAISPKDQDRYGYRIWIDKETSLLLRSELIDHRGQKLEIFMFNQLLVGDDVEDSALEPEGVSGGMVSHLTLQATDEPWQPPATAGSAQSMPSAWSTHWLPTGFAMTDSHMRHKPGSVSQVSSLMFSDGLAAFSIYVEPMPKAGAASMLSQNGATVAVTHQIEEQGQYFLVTLVGEIPVETARNIVTTVHQKKG